MRIPVWLTVGVAILVIVFGLHRIRLGFRSAEEEARARKRKGLYAMGRRTHILIGIVYLLLGAGLVATAYGWNPLSTVTPDDQPAATPTKLVPLDQPPPAKK